jgi:2-oxoglutarate dehydrogenase E1 component
VLPRLRRLAGSVSVRSVKRKASASPATGSAKAHELEQKALLALAFVE